MFRIFRMFRKKLSFRILLGVSNVAKNNLECFEYCENPSFRILLSTLAVCGCLILKTLGNSERGVFFAKKLLHFEGPA